MGLKLRKELENGTSGEYWKILHVTATLYPTACVRCNVALYASKRARDEKKAHLQIKPFTLEGVRLEDFLEEATPCGVCYDAIKALPEFAGAEDE